MRMTGLKAYVRPEVDGIVYEGNMYPIYRVYYMEEFVKRPPRDIRAIVIGDDVVSAIYRSSGNGN